MRTTQYNTNSILKTVLLFLCFLIQRISAKSTTPFTAIAKNEQWFLRGICITPSERLALFFEAATSQWKIKQAEEIIGAHRIAAILETGVLFHASPIPILIKMSKNIALQTPQPLKNLDQNLTFSPFFLHLDQVSIEPLSAVFKKASFPLSLPKQMPPLSICCSAGSIIECFRCIAETTHLLLSEHDGHWRCTAPSGLEIKKLTLRNRTLLEAEPQIKQASKALLSPKAQIIYDIEHGDLYIYDLSHYLNAFSDWLVLFDRPQAQILIEAKIVMMREEDLAEFGIQWQQNRELDSTPTTLHPATLITLKTPLLNLILNALATENHVEVLATPSILVQNHKTAQLKQGSELPYLNSGRSSVTFKEAMLMLQATPHLLPEGKIQVELLLTHNVPHENTTQNKQNAPIINREELNTQVILEPGQTVILGGITETIERQHHQNLPWLSSIPLLGHLFRTRAYSKQKQVLTLFITAYPQLIKLK